MKTNVTKTAVSLLSLAMLCAYITPALAQSSYGTKYQSTPPSYYNQQNYSQYNQNTLPPLQGHVVTIPTGAAFSAISSTDISTEYLTVGDTVSVFLGNDFYYNGALAIPANSRIEGNVVIAEKAGLAGKNGKLKIRFTNAITPSGQRVALTGKLSTPDGTGVLMGGTTAGRVGSVVKKGAVGAAVGALMGTVMGPLSGGKVGKGAYMGTAVGGGLGIASSVASKGTDVIIPANSKVDIVLDQPMTVTPSTNYGY